jgi:hypothetical protein
MVSRLSAGLGVAGVPMGVALPVVLAVACPLLMISMMRAWVAVELGTLMSELPRCA